MPVVTIQSSTAVAVETRTSPSSTIALLKDCLSGSSINIAINADVSATIIWGARYHRRVPPATLRTADYSRHIRQGFLHANGAPLHSTFPAPVILLLFQRGHFPVVVEASCLPGRPGPFAAPVLAHSGRLRPSRVARATIRASVFESNILVMITSQA